MPVVATTAQTGCRNRRTARTLRTRAATPSSQSVALDTGALSRSETRPTPASTAASRPAVSTGALRCDPANDHAGGIGFETSSPVR